MANQNPGFAGMDPEKQRRNASDKGHTIRGTFANDPQRAPEAGRRGAAAVPVGAKSEGGQRSHTGSQTKH